MQTVELLGDHELDRAVRAAWRWLDQAGLDSLGRHQHPTNRPHLTLATADEIPPGASAMITDALRSLPIHVRLDGLHFFGGRAGVLAWAVDGGADLRTLQARIWSALDGAGRNPQHEPRSWTPHISLARRLRPDQEPLAARVVGDITADGELNRARSYDTASRTVVPLSEQRPRARPASCPPASPATRPPGRLLFRRLRAQLPSSLFLGLAPLPAGRSRIRCAQGWLMWNCARIASSGF